MISRAAVIVVLMLVGCAANPISGDSADRADVGAAKRQVADTERAFARTMATRDHKAFSSFLSQEAVFFSGDKPLRGAQQVADWWKRYYEGPDAPFSWEPEEVEVLDSGTLAMSSGPVRDPRERSSPLSHRSGGWRTPGNGASSSTRVTQPALQNRKARARTSPS